MEGPGVDQEPKNLFEIDDKTGWIRSKRPLDREKYSSFTVRRRLCEERFFKSLEMSLDNRVLNASHGELGESLHVFQRAASRFCVKTYARDPDTRTDSQRSVSEGCYWHPGRDFSDQM